MISFADAVTKAKSVTSWTVGMCDNFVANMYGYSSSGYTTAMVHWNSIPTNDKHPGDMNAPAGALMFWGGGMGHVAISDGKGGIISTDMPNPGTVSTVPADTPTTKWGKPYLGWTVPYFQGQVGAVGAAGYVSPAGTTAPAKVNLMCLWSPMTCASGNTAGFNASDFGERLGLILLGSVMILIGLYKFTSAGGAIHLNSIGKAKKNGTQTAEKAEEEVEPE
jgi:hypothetical protein